LASFRRALRGATRPNPLLFRFPMRVFANDASPSSTHYIPCLTPESVLPVRLVITVVVVVGRGTGLKSVCRARGWVRRVCPLHSRQVEP